jgi:hypothetical protein
VRASFSGSITALVVAATCVVRTALGQPDPSAPLAETLFVEGKELMAKGDPESIRQACDKLAASQRIDPELGTLMNLALCHERQGKTASAWAEFTDAAALAVHAEQHDRERAAREHIASLEMQLHRLHVVMARATPDTTATLDGHVIPPEALAANVPLDPGDHVLEMAAPAKKKWSQAIHVGADAGTTEIRVELLDEEARPTEAPVVEGPPAEGSQSRRTLGIIVGSVAAAALVGGVALAFRARSLKSSSDGEAAQALQAEGAGNTASHDSLKRQADADYSAAVTSQTLAFVAGGIGIVGLGAGIYLLATVRTSGVGKVAVRVLPEVGLGSAGVRAVAAW